jgi:multidrug resistance protein, MATE family
VIRYVQGAAGGVFRGMGKQLTVMKRNLLGFWVLGLPTGGLLCFVAGMKLPGLWWGLTVGLSVTTAISAAHLLMIDWDVERDLAIERGSKNGSRDDDDANDDVVAEAAYVRGERENGGKDDNVV